MGTRRAQQEAIARAVADHTGGDVPAYREPEIPAAAYPDALTDDAITQGVVAFLLLNNMRSGSLADLDLDLYRLLKAYLLHPESRAELNTVVAHHR